MLSCLVAAEKFLCFIVARCATKSSRGDQAVLALVFFLLPLAVISSTQILRFCDGGFGSDPLIVETLFHTCLVKGQSLKR